MYNTKYNKVQKSRLCCISFILITNFYLPQVSCKCIPSPIRIKVELKTKA